MWSPATFRLGNPVQVVYLLVSTSSSVTTAVGSVSCSSLDAAYSCESRGRAFVTAESSTWSGIGQFKLDIRQNLIESYMQDNNNPDLGYGDFGRDSVKVGNDDNRNLRLNGKTIAVVNDTSQLLGSFGLAVKSYNFKGDEEYPSFLATLFDTRTIPGRYIGFLFTNTRCAF